MRRLPVLGALFAVLGFSAALPVLVVGLTSAGLLEEKELERSDREAAIVAKAVSAELASWLEVHVRATEALAAQVALATASTSLEAAKGTLEKLSELQHENSVGLYMCYVGDAAGRTIASHPALDPEGRPLAGVDVTGRDYFQRLRETDDTALSNVFLGRSSGRPAVVIAAPVRGASNVVRGFAACALDLERLREAVQQQSEGSSLHVVVLDGLGRVIAHPDAALRQRMQDLSASPLYAAVSGPKAEHRLAAAEDGRVMRAIATNVLSNDTRWLVVVGRPEASVRQIAESARSGALGSAVTALIFGLGLAALLAAWFVRPIAQLERVLGAIARGNLSVTPSTAGRFLPRELASLSDASREMVLFLRGHLGKLGGVIDRVGEVTTDISTIGEQVQSGSERAYLSIDASRRSVDDIHRALLGVGDSVEQIRQHSESTSASALEMEATSKQVEEKVEEMSEGVSATTRSVRQVLDSVEEIARRTREVSDLSRQTFSALTDMNALLDEVRSSTNDTARIAEEVAKNAEAGGHAVQETVDGIHRIKSSALSAAAVMRSLEQQMTQIDMIVDVIDGVADETQLLSLNASIIAAQTHESGHGFGVVATEIKSLAQRVSDSTRQIAGLLQQVQASARESVAVMDQGVQSVDDGVRLGLQAQASLEHIQDSSQRVMERIHLIVDATDRYSVQSAHVTQALRRISESIGEIASFTAEQSRNGAVILDKAGAMGRGAIAMESSAHEQAAASTHILRAIEEVEQRLSALGESHGSLTLEGQRVARAMAELDDVAARQKGAVEQLRQTIAVLSAQADVLRLEVRRFDAGGAAEKPGR